MFYWSRNLLERLAFVICFMRIYACKEYDRISMTLYSRWEVWKIKFTLKNNLSLSVCFCLTRTSLFLVSMPFDGVCLPVRLPLAMVPSWKALRHTHLARRLPLWSVSPFVSTMLMKALSVSTARTPGRLLMSSLFDRYRHPARTMLFFNIFFFYPSWTMLLRSCICMCVHRSVCVCVAKWERDKKEGAGQLIRTSL